MANIRNCEHTKDDGSPCGAVPVHNSPYCYFHRKFYNPPALPGEPNYVAPLLESHESIQLAATHLYQSFFSRKMDSKQVALALNILKLAAKSIATVEKARKRAEKSRLRNLKRRLRHRIPKCGNGLPSPFRRSAAPWRQPRSLHHNLVSTIPMAACRRITAQSNENFIREKRDWSRS